MKKLINDPRNVVKEKLAGMLAAHPDLIRVHFDPNFVVRKDAPIAGKVGIVSGGGSGHEPLHDGFVGVGMLDASCSGDVFVSPTPDQIFEATKAVNGWAGVLYIVKNFMDDRKVFEEGGKLAKAEGIEVTSVVIDDDVALEESVYSAGRRGMAATVLAEKLCGAKAEAGGSLEEVAEIARRVNANARSMGMGLTACTVPREGKPTFEISEDEIEIGVGIHGEPGRERMKWKPAAEITAMLARTVLDNLPFRAGDEVLAFVNGLGGTPVSELYIVFNELSRILKAEGIRISRSLVGTYTTSLEMAGCSITLLKMDDELKALWDAPVKTPALRWGIG